MHQVSAPLRPAQVEAVPGTDESVPAALGAPFVTAETRQNLVLRDI
jgi:hypothetical protein